MSEDKHVQFKLDTSDDSKTNSSPKSSDSNSSEEVRSPSMRPFSPPIPSNLLAVEGFYGSRVKKGHKVPHKEKHARKMAIREFN
jgi:hypothetical protein